MASLFYLPWAIVRDVAGIGVAGAQVYFTQTGTNTKKSVYQNSGLTTPHTNPVICDGVGNPPITYLDPTVSYRVRVYDRDAEAGVDTPIKDIDPYVPGIFADATALQPVADDAANSASAATNSAAVAAAAATAAEASETAAEAAAVNGQAVLVAIEAALAETGFTLAQLASSGLPLNVKWFGATGDGVTDDSAAFVAALAYLKSIAGNTVAPWYKGSGRLFIPAGHYYLGTTTLDVTHTLIIEGEDTGLMDAHSTKLRWAPGATGFRVQDIDTVGNSSTTSDQYAGTGTIIRNLYLEGGLETTATEGSYHAIHLRTRAQVENVGIAKWQGDGIHINADVNDAAQKGNASFAQVSKCRIIRIRNGIYIDGGDANVCNIRSVDVVYARRWGFWDSSFLGNRFESCHASACGTYNLGYTPSVVSQGGNWYAVVAGQETAASTNAPSGTTADNAYWYYVSAGAPDTVTYNIPAWSNGITVAAGGPYYVDNVNAPTTLDDCYSEGGQGPSQLPYLGLAVGGTHSAGVRGAHIGAHNGMPIANDLFSVEYPTNSAIRLQFGSGANPNDGILAHFNTLIGGANALALSFPAYSADVLHWSNWRGSFSDSLVPFHISMNNSTAGNAPWGPNMMNFPGGHGFAYKKRLPATVAPTTARLVGDYDINTAPTETTPMQWITKTGGTPGTQMLDYPNLRADPTTGVGYVTGAGGAVTQATSRTTAPPAINKVCGAITLVSAAGSASWQTFTVSNSTVAATDTIRVVQKSGTDKYMIHVTNVGAGTFDVTFATTGGTTTEQPVFNFSILKSVSS